MMTIFKMHYSLQFVLLLLFLKLSTGTQTVWFTSQSSHVVENAGTVGSCVNVFDSDIANTGTIEVAVTTSGVSAVQGVDFVALSKTLQFSGQAATNCFNIPIINDNIFENSENFTVTAAIIGTTAMANKTVNIIDDERVMVSLTNSSSVTLIITEGEDIRICAEVSSSIEQFGMPATASFAQSGQSPVPRTFSAGGARVQCLSVSNEDDQIFEDATTFTVSLSSSQNRVTATGMTTVTIMDNDDPLVGFVQSSYTVQEGRDETVSVCVRLLGPVGGLSRQFTVTLSATAGTADSGVDYTASDYSATRTFQTQVTVGSGSEQCIQLTIVDDTIAESSESFTISLTSSEPRVMVNGGSVASVTILDNDVISVGMQQSSITQSESAGDVMVWAVLNGPAGGLEGRTAVIQLTPTGQQSATKTFQSGSRVGSRQCITLPVTDDSRFENAITYTVSLSSSQNMVTATGRTTVTITDNDDPIVSFVQSSFTVMEGTDEMVSVCAVLLGPSGGLGRGFTVTLSASAGTAESTEDYTATDYSITRTFQAQTVVGGTSQQCIQLTIVDDTIAESSESFTISLTSSEPRVRINGESVASVTILDNDDSNNVTVGMQQLSITQSESTGDVMVCAVLTGPAGGLEGRAAVMIQLTPTGQQSVTRTFQSGSRVHALQCVALPVTDDERFEENETFTVSLSSSQNMVTATGSTAVTITDDDDPVVGLVQSSYTVREGTDEMVSVCAVLLGPSGGLAREFTVTLSATAGTAEPGSDYSATEYSVTRTFHTFITVGSIYQRCLLLNVTNDTIGEPIESFTVNLSSSNPRVMILTGRSVATVIIIDDDIPPGLMPEDFQVSATGPRSLSFSWRAPNNTNETIVGYNVSCSFSGQIVFNRGYVDAGSYEGTTFLPYTNYTCRAFARVMGNVGEAATRTVLTHEESPGSPPRSVNIQDSTSSSITLLWQPPVLSYGVITNYNLYINYTNGSEIERIEAPSATYTITQLFPYQNVTVEISAENSAGEGRQRAIVSARTRESNPGVVREVEFSVLNETILVVTWIPPEQPNGELLYYIVQLHSPMNMEVEVNTTMLTIQWTELEPYIPYNVSILAVNSAGEGEVYSYYVFTKEGAPTVSPKNVSVECLDDGTSIRVSWAPLTLLEARGRLTNYAVYYWVEIDAAVILNVDGTSNNVVIPGLELNTAYSVRVAATTIGGVGMLSNVYTCREVPTGDFLIIPAAVGSGVAFLVFIVLIIVACVGYCMRRKGKIPNNQGRNNETVLPECEIPLPTRRHVDVVPTNRCVAYGIPVNTDTGADSMIEYEELVDDMYETIMW